MLGLLGKIVISGVAVYAITRVLEETKILEKGLAMGIELADGLLTKIDKMTEGKAQI